MSRIYYYKLTADNGGAPCIDGNWLSLAICKPHIRSTAEKGSLVFGFAANSLHTDNRLIYIACITEEKLREGAYYKNKEYAARQDCIYEWRNGRYQWKPGSLHHGPNDVEHDLGKAPEYAKANVLLSNDFRYFGKDGSAAYKTQYPLIREAVEKLGRGHRVNHPDGLREQFDQMKAQMWAVPKNPDVKPSSEPQRGVCHRSKSCGEIR